MRDVLRLFGPAVGVLVVSLFAALLVSHEAPTHATQEFYSAAADVGVVLLVAIALEARLLRIRGVPKVKLHPDNEAFGRRLRFGLSLGLALAAALQIIIEERILFTLARGDFKRVSATPVFMGLTFGLVAVVLAGLLIAAEPR